MTITIPSSRLDENFNIDELTSGTLDGNGVFDVLMRVIHEHLKREFEDNRIRGTDYANAYVQLMQNALQQATQYGIEKAKLPLELQLLEANIHKTGAETILVTKQGGLTDAQSRHEVAKIRQTDYITNTKLPAETNQTNAQTDRIVYETNHLLPKQIDKINADIQNQEKQTELLHFDLTQLKPKELELKEQQIELSKVEVSLKEKQLPIMEKELEIKGQQLELGRVEISLKEKQIPLIEKEIEIKQNQIDLGNKEVALKEKQVGIAEKELAIKDKQLEITQYELSHKLPAEVASIKSQTSLYTQKMVTEKAQTDPKVIGNGSVIDVQNKLHTKQAQSYDRDAEQKLLNIMTDSWKVSHNADPDFVDNARNAINKFNNPTIGKAVETAFKGIGVEL